MSSLQTALNDLTKSKLSFYLTFAFASIALFALTTLLLLYSMISQLHANLATYDIQLFTNGEVEEIQSYFADWFMYSCLAIVVILLVSFMVLFIKRKNVMDYFSHNPLSFSLQLLIVILLAVFLLMALFVIFESSYQQFLQRFYQYSLDRFNDLPSFVLSNGDSGFAFSVRWPLSLDISSRTFFQMFMTSLVKAGSLLAVLVLPVSLFFRGLISRKTSRARSALEHR
ncbi:hypothetical protein JZO70_14435 [Enterococcus sp. 669A]|uniref:Uncharacterized protein n=1 Tax=Candidatus Enterococcus moelleringii TaxID=2815325 RepID=A0ABS3LCL0_9ENTE|nr:hypothetical protein [Enterococcus sp. 669A]MBO1307372.1 hypothetical protein [Enterococcus sp. 669A]